MLQAIHDIFFSSRAARWWLVALLPVLILYVASGYAHSGSVFSLTLLIFCAGFFVVALIVAIWFDIRAWPIARANRRAARQVRPALASGRALPIPRLPRQQPAVHPRTLERVQRNTCQMIAVPWGVRPDATNAADPDLRPTFDHTVAQLRALRGNFPQATEPAQIFSHMPAPWCYVGAAELMFRFSYLMSRRWHPYGLRQGLRFVALAQQADPSNADALVIRTKLLAACTDPRWMELAAQTYDQLRAVAPDHPRLTHVSSFLYWQAGDFGEALTATERDIAQPPSPEEGVAARADRAMLLWMLKRYEESIAAYEALLQSDDSDPWQWHNLSILLAHVRRYDEALAANQRALALMNFPAATDFGASLRARMGQAGTPAR